MKLFRSISMVAVVAAVAALAHADAPAGAPQKSTFVDATYGYSLDTPDFGETKTGIMTAQFFGPTKNDFRDNVNIIIQPQKITRKEYLETTTKEFKDSNLTLNSAKELTVSGLDAEIIDYEGTLQNTKVHCLALFVVAADKVYLVTCTASPDNFANLQPTFQKSLESFRLAGK